MSSESFWSAQQACFGRSLKYFKLFDNRFHVYHQPTINKKFDAEKCFCVCEECMEELLLCGMQYTFFYLQLLQLCPTGIYRGKKLEQKATHSKIIFLSSWLNFNLTFTFWPSRKRFLLFNHIAVPDKYHGTRYLHWIGGKFSTSAT